MPGDQTDRSSSFARKKLHILSQLSVPSASYSDSSPKGSVDVEIRDLINFLNACDGLVTTSSCSGRISVFLDGLSKRLGSVASRNDGARALQDEIIDNQLIIEAQIVKQKKPLASQGGGKGHGGRWLYVSHSAVALPPIISGDTSDTSNYCTELFGFASARQAPSYQPANRLIHFKFEPMILHLLTSNLVHAQAILSAAQQAGFRESGATSLCSVVLNSSHHHQRNKNETSPVMLAIRSSGLALDCIIGTVQPSSMEDPTNNYNGNSGPPEGDMSVLVNEQYLRMLVEVANERFKINTERINRFRALVENALFKDSANLHIKPHDQIWEDAAERTQRKKREGLSRQAELQKQSLAYQASRQQEFQGDEAAMGLP